MNVLILGAGEVGTYLANILSKEEHRVILVDKDLIRLEKLAKDIDVATVFSHASNWRLFKDLMGTSPDFFIAMTGSDETNLAACLMAKNLGYKKTICRITETGYLDCSELDFSRLFFVDHFLATEILSAQQILRSLLSPMDRLSEHFSHGNVELKTLLVPKSWKKSSICIKDLQLPKEMIIGLIWRKNREKPFIFPHGNDVLNPLDQITVVGESSVMKDIHELFSIPSSNLQSAVIVGGSNAAVHLAGALLNLDIRVKMIEKEAEKCEKLAEFLSKATIIHHDGSDLSFLLSEKVCEADAFITAMHYDEKNLLVGAIGKQAGAKQVISLISDMSIAPVFQGLGIDYALSGKTHMTNQILSIIHGKNIVSISSIFDDHARVIELKVSENSRLIGVPIKELSAYLPSDLLICVIESKGQVMIGKGDRILSPNDTVILITSPRHIHELEHLF